MTFEIEDHAVANIVRLQGELVGNNQAFVDAVTNLLTRRGTRVLFDMSGVQFMNSTGLADLVRIAAQGNVQEAEVVLAALTPFVAGVLQTTRLDRFFEIQPAVEDALAKWS